jgi:hypothetical protein
VPLGRIAAFLAEVGHWAIVEFVPKSDSQVQRLLASREDIFDKYTREEFETEFSRSFQIVESIPVPDSERVLTLLRAEKK